MYTWKMTELLLVCRQRERELWFHTIENNYEYNMKTKTETKFIKWKKPINQSPQIFGHNDGNISSDNRNRKEEEQKEKSKEEGKKIRTFAFSFKFFSMRMPVPVTWQLSKLAPAIILSFFLSLSLQIIRSL